MKRASVRRIAFMSLALLAVTAHARSGAANGADPDATFAVAALQGNDAEVAMAQLALRRSRVDEVRGFAQRMLEEHGQLALRLRAVAPDAGSQHAANDIDRLALVRLARLDAVAFDQNYLMQQVGDHLATLSLYESEADDGTLPALRAFARRELPGLRAHLEEALDATRHVGGSNPFKSH